MANKGYQYLENDFFELCKTRKIRPLPMLLYIYLRGLYCRFQKPEFFWPDKNTLDQLGITHPTLQKARKELAEKGLLIFTPGNGVSNPTQYTLIGNVLLPDLKVKKTFTINEKVKRSFTKGENNRHHEDQNLSPSNNTNKSNERDKKEIGSPEQEQTRKERWENRGKDVDKMIAKILGK